MKIQKAKRLNKVDFPDAPAWAGDLFKILNNQLERYVNLFQNNITFQDNMQTEKRKVGVTNDTSVLIKLNELKRNPIGILFLDSDYFDYPSVAMEISDSPLTVSVKVKWDTPPDGEVNVTLLFIGG